MDIPLVDLKKNYETIKNEVNEAILQTISTCYFVNGTDVNKFESEFAKYTGSRYCQSCNSGTDALYLALRSLDVGHGDEVITTPLSWIATANAIVLCGATPVFVDIGEDMNINADLIETAITEKTKVILPVHFTGRLCNMEKITQIATSRDIYIVEDAAQAFGASIHGAMAGSFGDVSAFSMNAMKVFNAYGEAGAAVTNNIALADKLRSLSYGGTINKEDCYYPSLNGRLDTIQAAMLSVSMMSLQAKIARRREIAKY